MSTFQEKAKSLANQKKALIIEQKKVKLELCKSKENRRIARTEIANLRQIIKLNKSKLRMQLIELCPTSLSAWDYDSLQEIAIELFTTARALSSSVIQFSEFREISGGFCPVETDWVATIKNRSIDDKIEDDL